MVNDIVMLEAYIRNSFSIFPLVLIIITIAVQKLIYLYELFLLIKMIFVSLKNKQIIDAVEIDQILILTNYINLSNILYERITHHKIKKNFLVKALGKEIFLMLVQVVFRISILLDEEF